MGAIPDQGKKVSDHCSSRPLKPTNSCTVLFLISSVFRSRRGKIAQKPTAKAQIPRSQKKHFPGISNGAG